VLRLIFLQDNIQEQVGLSHTSLCWSQDSCHELSSGECEFWRVAFAIVIFVNRLPPIISASWHPACCSEFRILHSRPFCGHHLTSLLGDGLVLMAMPLTLNSWHCTFATRRLEEETSSYTSAGVSCFIRQKEMAAVSLLVLPLLRLWVRSWISGCWPVRDELAPGRNHFPKRNYGQNWPLAHAQCSMPNAGRITQLRSPPIPVPPRQFPTTWGVRFSDRVVEWVSVGLVWVSGGHSPSQNRTKAKTKAKKWAKVHTTPHTHSPTHPHTHTLR